MGPEPRNHMDDHESATTSPAAVNGSEPVRPRFAVRRVRLFVES